MEKDYDKLFNDLKLEKLNKLEMEFNEFKNKRIHINSIEVARSKFIVELENRRSLLHQTIDKFNNFHTDSFKIKLLNVFSEYIYNSTPEPMTAFFEDSLPEIITYARNLITSCEKNNTILDIDFEFFNKIETEYIIDYFAKYYSIEEYINKLKNGDEPSELNSIPYEEPEADFELIELKVPDEKLDAIIHIIYEKLHEKHFPDSFEVFERHFKDNDSKKIKLEWLGNQGTLKGFVFLLEQYFKNKKKSINKWLHSHFYSKSFKTDPKNMKSSTERKAFLEILNKSKESIIVTLFDEIKNVLNIDKNK